MLQGDSCQLYQESHSAAPHWERAVFAQHTLVMPGPAASNELTMTQQLIADMLGVRREGVAQAVGELQEAGLVHRRRGQIAVVDRPRLEVRVCECYAVVKREYDRLLRPLNTVGDAGARSTHGSNRARVGEDAGHAELI